MDCFGILERVREKRPLVHHMTNWVSISSCADVTRALGALPVMAHATEEAEDMAGISSALVLNIGTLTSGLVYTMELAAKAANRKGIPVVLDAVGAGATKMRTDACLRLLKSCRIDILKGNAAEIAGIAGVEAEVKGVESISVSGDLKVIAKDLAGKLGSIVVITGKDDIVSDGKRTAIVSNGHELMGRVVGTGCMASSCIASFCAVEKDYLVGAAAALSIFGRAGELAAKKTNEPVAYRNKLIDSIASMKEEDFEQKVEIC